MRNKILQILRTEARAGNDQIARRLDLPREQVDREIERLEAERVILGYRAVINPEKLDEETTVGIIEVKITPQRNVGYDEIAAQIYRFPEVRNCYLLSGAYDLLLFIEGADLKEVANFVARKLATIDHVVSTTTHFVLRKYKEESFIIGDEDRAERLPVSP